ncbi:MAG TPA: hypothetical protein VD866_01070 [Urbifossiella sp.]|nr:hypothetical protein [Urbifossiella sp.]
MAAVKFTNADGREWAFKRITLADVDELTTLGLDVEAVSEDIGKLAELVIRRRAFAAVLWWFVGDAVVAKELGAVDLHRALDGDALARAVEAVRDAVIDFFPYPPAAKAKLIAELTAAPAGSAAAPSSSPPSPDSTPAA